jgi:hypothetical protein
MAINQESVRWASVDETDAVNGLANKIAPTASMRNSGLKRREPLSRNILNHQLNAHAEAFADLQAQITALTLNAGIGLISQIYGVGSYYMTEASASPATILGIGTWVRVQGRFLVGRSDTDSSFDGVGEEGGAKEHAHSNTLSVNGHAITPSEMPSHSHPYRDRYHAENSNQLSGFGVKSEAMPNNYNLRIGTNGTDRDNNAFLYIDDNTDSVGGSSPHTHGLSGGIASNSNLPPYRAVNIWRRTA